MGSTQREEMVPAPPPYMEQSSRSFAPPPFPPPLTNNANGQASSSSSQPVQNGDKKTPFQDGYAAAPPDLTQAPPTYEPFSFEDEYAAFSRSTAERGAPRWHSAPVYNVYHDQKNAQLSFHIALPSTLPPCACGTNFHCDCGRRRPSIWETTNKRSLFSSSSSKIELQRISNFNHKAYLALSASRTSKGSSSYKISNDRDQKLTDLIQTDNHQRMFEFIDGQRLSWIRFGSRLELHNAARQPFAIFHTNVVPARLELTAFPWARMPSDELECDYKGCSMKPLYGFVFRCFDCSERVPEKSEKGNLGGENDENPWIETFDICEAHLMDECANHPPNHRFRRLPRPFGEYDDEVYETPLLHVRDLQAQRLSQEIVMMTLACMLLEKQ
ncbi:uncharacterized protein FA14DRAFT_154940 [Meira miltonrushii]|uniref:Uncharacterized protein n=1 Tax=Meira miltonrushii TaxID=1280837 RepID=A0A316VEL7_9BASI|nr:uncharacterized protein FA14DRAFT_154940 [Meira miltonrushii]PWN35528.1 hypothetical protein FA14DRAFT_154940 [Meira miltonrushii]